MGEGGIFKQLTKALIERCLTAELDTHLEEEAREDFKAKIGEMDLAQGIVVKLKLTFDYLSRYRENPSGRH